MAMAAPVLLILLGNIFVFVMVLIQIRKIRANKSSSNSRSAVQDLRAVASISVLLGLAWSLGFFSFGPGKVVLMYLFTIFNSFQGKCVTWQLILKHYFFPTKQVCQICLFSVPGFFVFLFHCLMKENVRKQWRIHLCCGRFRLYNRTGNHFQTERRRPPLCHAPVSVGRFAVDNSVVAFLSPLRLKNGATL